MPHDPRTWDAFLPAAGIGGGGIAGTVVEVGDEADGQIVLTLTNGPALFVSFDRAEDPLAPGTAVELTFDWTRVAGPPASGITPLVVAWTAGGGVLQLAPEEPDPLDVAPGARLLGGPEFVLRVPAHDLVAWIDRLIRLPRRFVLDRRPDQLIWLGDLDPDGRRLVLHRLRRAEHHLLLDPAGTAAVSDLAPTSPLIGPLPSARSRWAGRTEVVGPAGRLTADLFAVESEYRADGSDRAVGRVVEALSRIGWPRDGQRWPPVWRQAGDGRTRWWAVHEDPSGCPIPLLVPELGGAACWVERGELLRLPAPPPPAAPGRRIRRP